MHSELRHRWQGRWSIATILAAALSIAATEATPEADAKGQPLPYPAGISMPWRLLNIDSEAAANARIALNASAETLAASWLTTPQAFTKTPTAIPPTRNNQKITDQIRTGQPKQALGAPSLTVEPSWCSIMNRHLFFVTVTDSKLNTLLGSAHTAISRADWNKLRTGEQKSGFLKEKVATLATAALGKAAANSKVATDALHVGLSVGKENTRVDEGSGWCLNQLLEEKLAARYTVARALGHDHLALIRDLLQQPAALRRPTRTLVMNWAHSEGDGFKREVPVKFKLSAALLEPVFGKHVNDDFSAEWSCKDASSATIDCVGPGEDALVKLLDDERNSLKLSDWPQVVKRDRAWVYLDRGRAWGLKMNDRLIADVDGQQVKGHVVHFFGPEQQLQSPSGLPIREGAVLYIRLNQKLPRLGTTFRFDPRAFPTKYPPQ